MNFLIFKSRGQYLMTLRQKLNSLLLGPTFRTKLSCEICSKLVNLIDWNKIDNCPSLLSVRPRRWLIYRVDLKEVAAVWRSLDSAISQLAPNYIFVAAATSICYSAALTLLPRSVFISFIYKGLPSLRFPPLIPRFLLWPLSAFLYTWFMQNG